MEPRAGPGVAVGLQPQSCPCHSAVLETVFGRQRPAPCPHPGLHVAPANACAGDTEQLRLGSAGAWSAGASSLVSSAVSTQLGRVEPAVSGPLGGLLSATAIIITVTTSPGSCWASGLTGGATPTAPGRLALLAQLLRPLAPLGAFCDDLVLVWFIPVCLCPQ